jgi:hypothetical protein
MRQMIARALKIFGIVWLIGWLLTWAGDIKGESEHRADYSITLPTGERRFNSRQFAVRMIEDGAVLFVVWPGAVWVEVGLRTGWICRSAEIGRC